MVSKRITRMNAERLPWMNEHEWSFAVQRLMNTRWWNIETGGSISHYQGCRPMGVVHQGSCRAVNRINFFHLICYYWNDNSGVMRYHKKRGMQGLELYLSRGLPDYFPVSSVIYLIASCCTIYVVFISYIYWAWLFISCVTHCVINC